tara:strand:- start:564 stop:911 length:348 start_codon:yes stop_codon:yes gene_type:complete
MKLSEVEAKVAKYYRKYKRYKNLVHNAQGYLSHDYSNQVGTALTSESDDDYNRSDTEDSHLKESMLPHPEVMRKLRKYRAKYRHYKSIYMDSEEGGWEYEGYVVTSEGDDDEEEQ